MFIMVLTVPIARWLLHAFPLSAWLQQHWEKNRGLRMRGGPSSSPSEIAYPFFPQ